MRIYAHEVNELLESFPNSLYIPRLSKNRVSEKYEGESTPYDISVQNYIFVMPNS